jgi:hypothetical protein
MPGATWTARLESAPRVDFDSGNIILSVGFYDAADSTFSTKLYEKNFAIVPPFVVADVVAAIRAEGQRVRSLQDALAAVSAQISVGKMLSIA